jgi:mannose-6-phosphate isomerase-like protein (cupin superfamily)
MLVPLDGEGELRFADHPPVRIKPGLVTYAPAHTEHDVINTEPPRCDTSSSQREQNSPRSLQR